MLSFAHLLLPSDEQYKVDLEAPQDKLDIDFWTATADVRERTDAKNARASR